MALGFISTNAGHVRSDLVEAIYVEEDEVKATTRIGRNVIEATVERVPVGIAAEDYALELAEALWPSESPRPPAMAWSLS